MAHAQKPDFVFRWNGRVHLNRWGRQFSWLLAAEVCASGLVMLDTPCSKAVWEYLLPTPFTSFPFTSPPCITMCHQVSNALYIILYVHIWVYCESSVCGYTAVEAVLWIGEWVQYPNSLSFSSTRVSKSFSYPYDCFCCVSTHCWLAMYHIHGYILYHNACIFTNIFLIMGL
jgi:hypothetical protein